MTEQSRPWIQTAFGGRVHIPEQGGEVDPSEFNIPDIAYQLAGQTRFLGALRMRFSVAQHSVWVCEKLMDAQVGLDVPLYGLLHDAHEFVINDVAAPVKAAMPPVVREWYKSISDAFDRAIFTSAGLDPEMPDWMIPHIKKLDYEAMCREAVLGLRGGPRSDWRIDVSMKRTLQDQAAWEPLKEVPIEEAAERFLALYSMLQDMRSGPVVRDDYDFKN